MKTILLALTAILLATLSAEAQSCTTYFQATTASIYDPVCISLLPGFETTTAGFEARIKLPEATAGRWSALLPWTPFQRTPGGPLGMVGIHTHVLPNGQVLTWEGHNDNDITNHTSHAYTWNPNPAAFNGVLSYPNVYDHYDNNISNIFCSGHTFLTDGRLLVAGGHYSNGVIDRNTCNCNTRGTSDFIEPGTGNVDGYIGLRDVNLYNYLGDGRPNGGNYVWQTAFASLTDPPSQMTYRRWYPTAITLSDGRVLVVSGQRFGGNPSHPAPYQATIPELYTPATDAWQTIGTADRQIPSYPWLFQLPNGLVFNAGPNYRTGYFNPTTSAITTGTGTVQPNTWADGPLPAWGTPPAGTTVDYSYAPRGYGTAVMYQPGKLLMLGGSKDGTNLVTNTTELIDFGQATPQWQRSAPMQYPRYHANATLLADGSVLVSGGTTQNTTVTDAPAVRPTELWTPDPQALNGGSWREMAALDAPRLYHSTAVLLPDATVLTTGGGQGAGYADHPDYQIFTPPYLCQPNTTRPSISYAPPTVAYGQPFRVQSPNAGSIVRATWVRLSSVTHSFNMNQRFLELAFTYPAGTTAGAPADELVLTAPGSPTDCPPGHYLLFLFNTQGVPSVASILQVSTSACAASITLTATPTQTGPCTGTIHFAVSASAGNQADYQWQLNGQPANVPVGQPYYDYAATNTAPTANVQVTATRSCAGPAAVAGQQVTMYFKGCSGQPYERPAAGR